MHRRSLDICHLQRINRVALVSSEQLTLPDNYIIPQRIDSIENTSKQKRILPEEIGHNCRYSNNYNIPIIMQL